MSLDLLGIWRVCSDDSLRPAMGPLWDDVEDHWKGSALDRVVRPLLGSEWILDVDPPVKPVYGPQTGGGNRLWPD